MCRAPRRLMHKAASVPSWEVCSEASAQVQYHRCLKWNQISGFFFFFAHSTGMIPHKSSTIATQIVLGTQC